MYKTTQRTLCLMGRCAKSNRVLKYRLTASAIDAPVGSHSLCTRPGTTHSQWWLQPAALAEPQRRLTDFQKVPVWSHTSDTFSSINVILTLILLKIGFSTFSYWSPNQLAENNSVPRQMSVLKPGCTGLELLRAFHRHREQSALWLWDGGQADYDTYDCGLLHLLKQILVSFCCGRALC